MQIPPLATVPARVAIRTLSCVAENTVWVSASMASNTDSNLGCPPAEADFHKSLHFIAGALRRPQRFAARIGKKRAVSQKLWQFENLAIVPSPGSGSRIFRCVA